MAARPLSWLLPQARAPPELPSDRAAGTPEGATPATTLGAGLWILTEVDFPWVGFPRHEPPAPPEGSMRILTEHADPHRG